MSIHHQISMSSNEETNWVSGDMGPVLQARSEFSAVGLEPGDSLNGTQAVFAARGGGEVQVSVQWIVGSNVFASTENATVPSGYGGEKILFQTSAVEVGGTNPGKTVSVVEVGVITETNTFLFEDGATFEFTDSTIFEME